MIYSRVMSTRGRPVGSCLPSDVRKTRMNFTMSPDLAAAFREHCDKHGLVMSELIAEMIADRISYREAAE